MKAIHLFAFALTLLATSLAQAQPKLPPEVLEALAKAGVPPEAFAVSAVPLAHRAAPVNWRADVPMQPASTMKLVTSVVALDRLGPNHRSSTEFLSAAPLQEGALQGDLVLKGGADPELGLPQFWALLVDLKQRGVNTINGDLVIDRTLFRPARMDLNTAAFDQAPEFQYNVIPDALELAGNLLPLEINADASAVRVAAVPALDGLEVTHKLTLNNRACRDWDADWKPAFVEPDAQDKSRTRIELQGSFPANCTKRIELQLIDRLELAERLFRTLWKGLGGQWTGTAREAAAPEGAKLLVKRTSRPWGEVLRPMNKTSDNPVTRLLFLQLGVPLMAVDAQATTAELAARAVREWFTQNRIDTTGLVLDNGSGLSRSERITPTQMASLLAVAWRSPYAPDLLMSLPVAGTDGSVRPLKDSPAAGWARLKPGTLRNVVALAGYMRDPQGRPWAVSMMINHDDASRARPALLAFVDQFSRLGPAGPALRKTPAAQPQKPAKAARPAN
jgi:D-alanyl-D-alanine carboxypeptidase/D-alanyl-D-alanine-endopeptidase (penicillin-binding protein 4)